MNFILVSERFMLYPVFSKWDYNNNVLGHFFYFFYHGVTFFLRKMFKDITYKD